MIVVELPYMNLTGIQKNTRMYLTVTNSKMLIIFKIQSIALGNSVNLLISGLILTACTHKLNERGIHMNVVGLVQRKHLI